MQYMYVYTVLINTGVSIHVRQNQGQHFIVLYGHKSLDGQNKSGKCIFFDNLVRNILNNEEPRLFISINIHQEF